MVGFYTIHYTIQSYHPSFLAQAIPEDDVKPTSKKAWLVVLVQEVS